jgi:hypothetical protein
VRPLLLSLLLLAAGAAPAAADHPLEGSLSGVHADDFEDGSSTTRWRLDTGDRTVPVLPTTVPALAPGRAMVTLADEDAGGGVAGPAASLSSRAAAPLGARRLAVIAINFASDPSEPWTTAEVRRRVFTGPDSTSAFFREESYGGLWLTGSTGNLDGDVFGWYTLDTPTAGCPYTSWGGLARSAAAADGFNAAAYQHVMYVFPYRPSCGWAGLAYLPGTASWINGELTVQVTAHELGHNLGLHHAGAWECRGPGARLVTLSSSCELNEYDDPFDVMGNHGHRHSHGWHLQRLGVLDESNVQTVTESGTYSIAAALEPTAEPTTLRIPRTRGPSGTVLDWYYFEVRESGGVFDDFSLGDWVVNGVSIRVVDDPSLTTRSRLLDTRPGTGAGTADAALGVGSTFSDGRIGVTTISALDGAATVEVAFDEVSADVQAPSVPGALSHTLVGGAVRLGWAASSDDSGVTAYHVYRDGVQVGSSAGVWFDDAGVPPGPHVYTVYAEDAAGNRSAASLPYTVAVPAPGVVAIGAGSADGGPGAAGGGGTAGTAAGRRRSLQVTGGRPADRSGPVVRLSQRRVRGGRLVLGARARDEEGVAHLELRIDGRRVRARGAARLVYRWKPRRPGRHRLAVKAIDARGNVSTLVRRVRA